MSDEVTMRDPYPVTIVRSRYGGTYEPGAWIAFPLDPEDLPVGYAGDDVECVTFFGEYRRPVGGGTSPDAAYADLRRQLREPKPL
jgi:hypothetical protein